MTTETSSPPAPRPACPTLGADARLTMEDLQDISPLAAAYLERREDMRRFFLARLGGRGDVEDLVQELYLKVQAVTEEPIEHPSAYLYRLASNLMLDRLTPRQAAGARETEWRRTHHALVGDSRRRPTTPDAESAVIARQRLEKASSRP